MMKRPGVAEKTPTGIDEEPDFYEISEQNPVPDRADDDSILLHCTLQGGPKARMPIYYAGTLSSSLATTGGVTGTAVVGAPAYSVSPAGVQTQAPNTLVSHHNYPSLPSANAQIHQQTYHHQHQTAVAVPLQPHISQQQQPHHHVGVSDTNNGHVYYSSARPASYNGIQGYHTEGNTPQQSSMTPVSPNPLQIGVTNANSNNEGHVHPQQYQPVLDVTNGPNSSAASQFAAGFAFALQQMQQMNRPFLGQTPSAVPASSHPPPILPAGAHVTTAPAAPTQAPQQQAASHQSVHQQHHTQPQQAVGVSNHQQFAQQQPQHGGHQQLLQYQHQSSHPAPAPVVVVQPQQQQQHAAAPGPVPVDYQHHYQQQQQQHQDGQYQHYNHQSIQPISIVQPTASNAGHYMTVGPTTATAATQQQYSHGQ
jgi:hypothetical protein